MGLIMSQSARISADRILYQDEHFLAVHKLSGELVVRGKGPVGKLPLLDFLKKDFPGLRPVNRLDFETSGVVLFARTKAALAAMMPGGSEEDLHVRKTYCALVSGAPPLSQGTIRTPLPARASKELIPAETKYRVLERFDTVTFVEAEFTSGRHHQIRKHFQSVRCPLILDPLYGNAKANVAFTKAYKYRKFFLHASRLSFLHPFTKQEVKIEAPLPRIFQEVLKKLEK